MLFVQKLCVLSPSFSWWSREEVEKYINQSRSDPSLDHLVVGGICQPLKECLADTDFGQMETLNFNDNPSVPQNGTRQIKCTVSDAWHQVIFYSIQK